MNITCVEKNEELTFDDLNHGDFVQFETYNYHVFFGIFINFLNKKFILCLEDIDTYFSGNVKHIYFKCSLDNIEATIKYSKHNSVGNLVNKTVKQC